MQAKGNEENAFDRVDSQLSTNDPIHVDGNPAGQTDQRPKIEALNFAPT